MTRNAGPASRGIVDRLARNTQISARKDESRLMDMALVELAGAVLALMYVIRGKDVRVISLRRASRKERSIYEQAPK